MYYNNEGSGYNVILRNIAGDDGVVLGLTLNRVNPSQAAPEGKRA